MRKNTLVAELVVISQEMNNTVERDYLLDWLQNHCREEKCIQYRFKKEGYELLVLPGLVGLISIIYILYILRHLGKRLLIINNVNITCK